MKLKKFSIKGLNNKVDCDWDFHDDINIVTGINGCGKTTFLKMLWYAISGNFEHLISEISFESFNLETSYYSLSLNKKSSGIEWQYIENAIKQNGIINSGEYNPVGGIEALKNAIIQNETSSLFFPTFRRIEGGYSIINNQNIRLIANPLGSFTPSLGLKSFTPPFSANFPITSRMLQADGDNDETSIKHELDKLSNRLTIEEHKFICSISTHDLGRLLTSRYAKASEKTNEDFLRFSALISSQIEDIKSDIASDKQEALAILSKLQQENTAVNNKRNELLKPFEILSELVVKILDYKGIKVDGFSIGNPAYAIDSKLLSSGEQQMLSFLCYNAFYENSVIFIDEPELSLHPDWQRRLFPNLMKQQSSNQFIVATHSPMIYSKYSDKEIILSSEKGE
jgi:predicted ATPase